MDRIGAHWQRLRRKDGPQRNFSLDHLGRNNPDQLRNRFIQIQRFHVGRFSFVQHLPQAENDFARALFVPNNVGKDLANLGQIRRIDLEQHLRGFRIA